MAAVVRGNCLGGGMELAAFCNWIFASQDAKFGQPEIALGVFAPVASVILPFRIGQSAADHLLLGGHLVDAEEAEAMGLITSVSEAPDEDFNAFVKEYIVPKSAVGLSYAVRAARTEMYSSFKKNITQLETMYLSELMKTQDANEGIQAFIEKREPKWQNK